MNGGPLFVSQLAELPRLVEDHVFAANSSTSSSFKYAAISRMSDGMWSSNAPVGKTSPAVTGSSSFRRSSQRAASDSCASLIREPIWWPKSPAMVTRHGPCLGG